MCMVCAIDTYKCLKIEPFQVGRCQLFGDLRRSPSDRHVPARGRFENYLKVLAVNGND